MSERCGPAPVWSDDERIAVAVLAGLTNMTTARLRWLIGGRSPIDALEVATGAVGDGGPVDRLLRRRPELAAAWSAELVPAATEQMSVALDRFEVRVVGPADAGWPEVLRVDPDPPAVLFAIGSIDETRRRVAVIGTRNPTEAGRQTAARLGYELSDAGVSVVSGLALGIDGAAHRGSLASDHARPIGVVANGLDRPYPSRHAALWRHVARNGWLVSEWPPGTKPDAFRFPQRNRIIAALAEVVVVVESREKGGSLVTAREAAERGVEVMAVPGSPDARSSAGTNELVHDGAGVVLSTDDVLDVLGLDHSRSGRLVDTRRPPDVRGAALLAVLAERPSSIEGLLDRSGRTLSELAFDLARLERDGWVHESDGWFQALDAWARVADVGGEPS